MAERQINRLNASRMPNYDPGILNYSVNDTSGYTFTPPTENPVNTIANTNSAINKQSEFNKYVNNMIYGNNNQMSAIQATTLPRARTTLIGENKENFGYPYELSDEWGTALNNRFVPIVSDDNWVNAEKNAISYVDRENYQRPSRKGSKPNYTTNIYSRRPPPTRERYETDLNTTAASESIMDEVTDEIPVVTEKKDIAENTIYRPIIIKDDRNNNNRGMTIITIVVIAVLLIGFIIMQSCMNYHYMKLAANKNISNNTSDDKMLGSYLIPPKSKIDRRIIRNGIIREDKQSIDSDEIPYESFDDGDLQTEYVYA